jgi:hypothetical protein
MIQEKQFKKRKRGKSNKCHNWINKHQLLHKQKYKNQSLKNKLKKQLKQRELIKVYKKNRSN